jgi:hypothetical protein
MSDPQERRQSPRFSAIDLDVLIRNDGEADPASRDNWHFGKMMVDFNRHGAAILSRHPFTVGEDVFVVIKAHDGAMSEVRGTVCNRTTVGDLYRLGVQFDYSDHAARAGTDLDDVEARLQRRP